MQGKEESELLHAVVCLLGVELLEMEHTPQKGRICAMHAHNHFLVMYCFISLEYCLVQKQKRCHLSFISFASPLR